MPTDKQKPKPVEDTWQPLSNPVAAIIERLERQLQKSDD